jgi:alkylhydroperoxidase family enzyme
MPNTLPLSDAQASDAAKNLFAAIQAKFGMVPNIFRTMGHAPAVLQATLSLDAAIQHDLYPKLRELAYLKTSQLNGCNY